MYVTHSLQCIYCHIVISELHKNRLPYVNDKVSKRVLPYPIELIVYQMGRLCGGAHEISGIKAPIFLRGWVVGGGTSGGWVGG